MPKRHEEIADIIHAEGRAIETPENHVKRVAIFVGVLIVLALIFALSVV